MKTVVLICLFFLLSAVSATAPPAQQSFEKIENLIISIRASHGELIYPKEYFALKTSFEELRTRTQGRELTDTEEKDLADILLKLETIRDAAEKARPFLTSVFKARQQAVENSAADFAPDRFQNAENELQEIAKQIRKNGPEKLEGKINRAFNLYREAQFQSIRNKLLSEVRILIRESRDLGAEKLTPRTLDLVLTLLKEVETILDSKQFSDPTLQEKAARLSAESQHMLYLVQVARRVKRDDSALEEFLLSVENSVRKLAEMLNYDPQFSEGVEPVLGDIQSLILDLKSENSRLSENNRMLRDSLQKKQQEILGLREELANGQDLARKIERLQAAVESYGVVIWQQGNEIILRLNKLEFAPGKITVSKDVKPVLEALGRSLREFSNNNILVRIAQQSRGNDQYNLSLATQRSKSAALVIQSAGYIPEEHMRSEGMLLPASASEGYVVLEVVIDLAG